MKSCLVGAFARADYKAVLIDLDPQFNLLLLAFGQAFYEGTCLVLPLDESPRHLSVIAAGKTRLSRRPNELNVKLRKRGRRGIVL